MLAPGFLDCETRIERATSTDTVVSCTGEKAYQGPNQKFAYDIRAKARPQRVKDDYVRENTIIEETIGPAQIEGDKLWFGKTFYDGEGNSGMGVCGSRKLLVKAA